MCECVFGVCACVSGVCVLVTHISFAYKFKRHLTNMASHEMSSIASGERKRN